MKKQLLRYVKRLVSRIKRIYIVPRIQTHSIDSLTLRRLGSKYGGWTFVNLPSLHNSTVISAGAGQDISFDVEFAKNYNAKIIIIDPTPKATRHISDVLTRKGKKNTSTFNQTGKQIPSSYDMSNIDSMQILHVDKALWVDDSTVKFFSPPNVNDVSYSITNIQDHYNTSSSNAHINVKSITYKNITNEYKAHNVSILKMDIEGAEVFVLPNIIESCPNNHPDQILVEYDGIMFPSKKYCKDLTKCDNILREHGYVCVHKDGPNNFLYIKNSIVEMSRGI